MKYIIFIFSIFLISNSVSAASLGDLKKVLESAEDKLKKELEIKDENSSEGKSLETQSDSTEKTNTKNNNNSDFIKRHCFDGCSCWSNVVSYMHLSSRISHVLLRPFRPSSLFVQISQTGFRFEIISDMTPLVIVDAFTILISQKTFFCSAVVTNKLVECCFIYTSL